MGEWSFWERLRHNAFVLWHCKLLGMHMWIRVSDKHQECFYCSKELSDG